MKEGKNIYRTNKDDLALKKLLFNDLQKLINRSASNTLVIEDNEYFEQDSNY